MYAPDPNLYYSASARIQWLKSQIDKFKLVSYPTKSPKELLKVLDKSCDRLQRLADFHLEDWKTAVKDRRAVGDALRFLHNSIGSLGEYLAIFESAGFDKARPEIALPLELLINEWIPASQDHEFIFHATYEFNFFYKDFYADLTNYLFFLNEEEEQQFFRDLPKHVALISFSALERENIFTLIILLHELAHYYDQSQTPPLSEVELAEVLEPDLLKRWVDDAKSVAFVPDFLEREFSKVEDIPPEVLDFALTYSILLRAGAAATWLRELTADIIAARLGGLAFYLTAKKFLGFFPLEHYGSYPPNYRRFHEIARALIDPADGIEKDLDVSYLCRSIGEFSTTLDRIMEEVRRDHKEGDVHAGVAKPKPALTDPREEKKEYLEYLALQIVEKMIGKKLERVWESVTRDFPAPKCCRLSEQILWAASYLIERIPPCQLLGKKIFEPPNWIRVDAILCASWLAWIHESSPEETARVWGDRRRTISRLTLRGIELSDYLQRHYAESPSETRKNFANLNVGLRTRIKPPTQTGIRGVASRREIIESMTDRDVSDMLVITPVLDADQIGGASVDVRLGNGFIVIRQARALSMEVTPSRIIGPGDYEEKIVLPYDGHIVLHPGEFMLGSTLEYICLPNDMMAYVIGKSSLGRLGLIIATATHIAPGYKGTPTLELSNIGTIPIKLYPKVAIAQLVFHLLQEPVEVPYHKRGKFAYTIGPQMPPLTHEADL